MRRPTRRRAALLALLAVMLAVIGVATTPAAALAQETGTVIVPANANAGLVVAGGDTLVQGTAETVVALTGDVTVAGTVRGAAIAVDGRVRVLPGGRVEGDAYSSSQPVVEAGGVVTGVTDRIDARRAIELTDRSVGLLWWVATTIALLALGTLLTMALPRVFDLTIATGTAEVGRAAITGLLLAIGLPALAIFLAITVVGIPLALAVILMLVPLYALGQLAAAWVVGAVVQRRRGHRVLALVTGVWLLQILAAVPALGVLSGLAAAYGLGALAVVTWRAARAAATSATPPPVLTT
jgi:hypothetical protein